MNDEDFIDHLVNAFGNEHFDLAEVLEVLSESIEQRKADGKKTGSLLALINILPEIEDEAKKRY